MTLKQLSTLTLLFTFNFSFSNEPILVTESTIILDLEQTKELFFSFAEGDEILFDMQMIKGKHIKEIEVVEMPSNSVLTEFKAKDINNKRIHIRNKGIYKFRFYSSSLTRRVCKIKIHRIPKSETTEIFNTNWRWETVRDTTYTSYQKDSLVGYQTLKYKETVRELKSTKIEEILLFDKSQKINSLFNNNKSRTYLKVSLPLIENNQLKEEKLLAWSYWIGVGKESHEAYNNNIERLKSLTKGIATAYTSPLGAFAIGEVTELLLPNVGDDVQYYFIHDYQNVELFMNYQEFLQFDMGKGKAAYGRNDRLKDGLFYIALYNDNDVTPINVDVKVIAIKEIKTYENITYNREKENPQYITLHKTRMNINETRIRVPVE